MYLSTAAALCPASASLPPHFSFDTSPCTQPTPALWRAHWRCSAGHLHAYTKSGKQELGTFASAREWWWKVGGLTSTTAHQREDLRRRVRLQLDATTAEVSREFSRHALTQGRKLCTRGRDTHWHRPGRVYATVGSASRLRPMVFRDV
jgi:hypothetical protein